MSNGVKMVLDQAMIVRDALAATPARIRADAARQIAASIAEDAHDIIQDLEKLLD